jgi:exonuclease SbcD
MIRFIHTADIHFGVENYGKTDIATGIHSRLLDFKRALDFCIDVALDEKVDFFLFAGDAYKTAHPTPTQQRLLMQCFLRLYKAHIPVVIIIGNHDHPLSFGKAHSLDLFESLPVDGFHVISKPKTILLETAHGQINIVGIPWPTRNTIALAEKNQSHTTAEITGYISESVSHIIQSIAAKIDHSIPAVLAGHLTVSNGIFSGSEKRAIYGNDPLLLPSQLAIPPFDYVALGHLHRHQNLNLNGYPPIVYSGSIERVDFGERKEDKGFCLVSIKNKGDTSYAFIKTPQRPFIQIEVFLEEEKDHTQQIKNAIAQHTITDAVVKIIYHLPSTEKDMVDLKAIYSTCKEALFIVGVIPIRKTTPRARRTITTMDMSLNSLLNLYFDAHEQLKNRKNKLIEKALEIEKEINQSKE